MLAPDYPIATARLRLRPVAVEDAPALAAYQSLADVCRYIPYEPRGADVLRERIADPALNRSSLDAEGQNIWLAVVRQADDVLVGDVVFMYHSEKHRCGEIGYVLDPRYAGNGYATEAAAALLRLGFGELGLHRIVGRIDARNEASAAVLHRLGMRQEAVLVENEFFKGEWTDEIDFAILDREWRARQ